LEALGYLVRVADVPRPVVRVLSMELPFSLPRMYVAALFATAALVAGLGAGRMPGRRTWWSAVAVLAAGIAVVKAGGEMHKLWLQTFGGYDRPLVGLLVSAPLALAAIGWLSWLSRHERRDRRRLILAMALYAASSVGLSAVSSAAEGAWGHGSPLTSALVFIEETGEALSGIAYLFAVLLGVAPRLVLPAFWGLRREADEHTIDARLPGGVLAERSVPVTR
jgi:hypothetical protein